jgi:hypothetical protein
MGKTDANHHRRSAHAIPLPLDQPDPSSYPTPVQRRRPADRPTFGADDFGASFRGFNAPNA